MLRMDMNDQAAIQAVLAGDKEAYAALVVRHSGRLFRVAFRITGKRLTRKMWSRRRCCEVIESWRVSSPGRISAHGSTGLRCAALWTGLVEASAAVGPEVVVAAITRTAKEVRAILGGSARTFPWFQVFEVRNMSTPSHEPPAIDSDAVLATALKKLWPHREHESNCVKAFFCLCRIHRWRQLNIQQFVPQGKEVRFCHWCSKIRINGTIYEP